MGCRAFLIIGLTVFGVYACTPAQPVESEPGASNPFVGAWLITETSVTDPTGTTVNDNPEPGLYVFTERHFSNMLIPGSERVRLSPERTDEERLSAYDNFIADAGTYEYTESTLTVDNIIAKVPNVMPPREGFAMTYEWRLDGEQLVITFRDGWAPMDGEITYRLSRLE